MKYWWAVVQLAPGDWQRITPMEHAKFMNTMHWVLPGWQLGLQLLLRAEHCIHWPRGSIIPIPICGDINKPLDVKSASQQVNVAMRHALEAMQHGDYQYSLTHYTPQTLFKLRTQQEAESHGQSLRC